MIRFNELATFRGALLENLKSFYKKHQSKFDFRERFRRQMVANLHLLGEALEVAVSYKRMFLIYMDLL